MRVADAREILAGRAELHRDHTLGDELGRQWTDHMHAKNAIARGVGQDLDEARRVAHRARPSIGRERKAAGTVSDAFCLQLLLGLADPRDFRRSVDDPGHRIEIDVPCWPAMRSATATPSSSA